MIDLGDIGLVPYRSLHDGVYQVPENSIHPTCADRHAFVRCRVSAVRVGLICEVHHE